VETFVGNHAKKKITASSLDQRLQLDVIVNGFDDVFNFAAAFLVQQVASFLVDEI
jgi:hypothetical protein